MYVGLYKIKESFFYFKANKFTIWNSCISLNVLKNNLFLQMNSMRYVFCNHNELKWLFDLEEKKKSFASSLLPG